jgi:YbbR domain-containing protein
MKWLFRNFGYKVLAAGVALLLWGVSHGTKPIERGFDVPVTLSGVPDDLVVTEQSTEVVNIRLKGSRAVLRNFSVADVDYPVDLSGAKPGVTLHEVDAESVKRPRGAEPVSRSPSSIEFTLEPRGTKAVKVRPDLAGEPAEGFAVGSVEVEPLRVRITGARREVLRLNEVVTETIDIAGIDQTLEREVRPLLAGPHLWLDDEGPIKVRIEVLALEPEAGFRCLAPTGSEARRMSIR